MTTTTKQRPIYWTGVDAQIFEGGQIEIEWSWIDTVIENCGGDYMEAYHQITELAIEARNNGDPEEFSWLASMGMACFNYGAN